MTLPTPNMDSCCKKQRCLSGVNTGQVHDTCDPCQGSGFFNAALCDCEGVGVYRVTVVSNGWNSSTTQVLTTIYYAEITEPFIGGDGKIYQKRILQDRRLTDYSSSAFLSVTPNEAGETAECNAQDTTYSQAIIDRYLELPADGVGYCDEDRQAGTIFGSVSFRTVDVAADCVTTLTSRYFGPDVLWAKCNFRNTAYANYTIEFLGAGSPSDFAPDPSCLNEIDHDFWTYTC